MHALEKKLQFSTEIAVCLRNNTRRRQVSGVAILRPISARYARVEFDKQRSNSAACNRDVLLMGHARPMPRTTLPASQLLRTLRTAIRIYPERPKSTKPVHVNSHARQYNRAAICLSVCLSVRTLSHDKLTTELATANRSRVIVAL